MRTYVLGPGLELINKLVVENLKHRPVRTLLSTIAIGVQVTMVLTLVGLSRGVLEDQVRRSRGVGADILVRPPNSVVVTMSGDMTEKIVPFMAKQPHVVLATGTLIEPTGMFTSVTGVDFPEFSRMTGGFRFVSGGPFRGPDDIIVDEYYAKQNKVRVGDTITVKNHRWHVSGIFEQGKLARLILPLQILQNLTGRTGKVTSVYVKLDNPANTRMVIDYLKAKLPDYQILSIDEFVSQFSVNNVPMLRQFIYVVIGLGVIVGFLVVFLAMYTAVLERTREIGVLKAIGASQGFILNVLLRETALLAVMGTVLGIIMTYGTRWLVMTFVPGTLNQTIVPDWWPIAAAIAIGGALLGAAYPGVKAARQDAIEALAYE